MIQDNQQNQTDDYDTPNIIGDVDTVEEEVEVLEKKFKIPVVIWIVLIIVISIVALALTMGQSPTLNF